MTEERTCFQKSHKTLGTSTSFVCQGSTFTVSEEVLITLKILEEDVYEAWLVGGFVRNLCFHHRRGSCPERFHHQCNCCSS